MLKFSIADISLIFEFEHSLMVTDDFLPFLMGRGTKAGAQDADWTISFRKQEELPELGGNLLYSDEDYRVYGAKEDFQYLFLEREKVLPYAVTRMNPATRTVEVVFHKDAECFFSETGNSLYHTDWEKIMICENRLLMHASLIDTAYGGVLFTGPSGIGKTTQSNLWEKYEGAETINGDRPILLRGEEGWRAYGSPYAGSSKCHKNKSVSVKAIVVLQQAKKCSLRKIEGYGAFRMLYPMMTTHSWDPQFSQQVCDLTIKLSEEIPVYELACTPDRAAVDILREALEEL